jgi:predicted ferric reductase
MKNAGWSSAIILAILPLIYLILIDPNRFSSAVLALNSLGKMSALCGAILFSITLMLQTRIVAIEKLFGGLDKAYKAHHILGSTSFLLLLFHPLFLAAMYGLTSMKSGALFLLPGGTIAINFGIYALVAMILFLIFTFFVSLSYEKWKFTHQFMAVAFLLASVHMFFISSDIQTYLPLRIYFIVFIILGLFAIAYRKWLWRYLGKRHSFKVSDVKMLSETIIEISFSPLKKMPKFTAGQFVFVKFLSPKISQECHPFTISSGSNEPNLRLSIKKLGDFTSTLNKVQKNTKAVIEGPFGVFCPSLYEHKKQVWIAGGIGITPFLSMARSLEEKDTRNIVMIYSVVSKEEALFLQELQEVGTKVKGFKVIPYYAKEQGFLTMDYVGKQAVLKENEIFICGPPPMMTGLKKQAKKIGIKPSRIHMEEFTL